MINKKVILYGVRGEGRKEIEFYLSNSYEIIGYSDSDEQYFNCCHINYIRFFRPDELAELEFDYIIITSKYLGISNEIKQKIVLGGVEKEKILQYALFRIAEYPHPYEVFQKVSLQFQGFVFGMSHAREGINVNLFKGKIFNFSVGSNDLFGIYHLLNKIYKENDKLSDIKYCILELPYYIFNWDCSKSNRGPGRMNCYTILQGEENQYHNLNISDGDLIRQYYIYEQMFKEKKMYNTSVCNMGIYDIANVIADQDYIEISDVWKMQYEETIKENTMYLKQTISLLHQINSEIKVYIVIFPQNPRFYHAHEEVIEKARKQFYEIINDNKPRNVTVWDYFNLYDKREDYFMDDCHLNTLGRNQFSKKLEERINL